jgi:bifunctional non-homologous end joining protein LigD
MYYSSLASLILLVADPSKELRAKDAILDGQIVCLDQLGHTQFNRLIFRRGDARVYAFDLLWLNGEDLRGLSLVDRKEALRKIVPARSSRLLYVDHVDGRGEDLFRLACERDLEGIVAWKRGAYISDDHRTSWLKITRTFQLGC